MAANESQLMKKMNEMKLEKKAEAAAAKLKSWKTKSVMKIEEWREEKLYPKREEKASKKWRENRREEKKKQRKRRAKRNIEIIEEKKENQFNYNPAESGLTKASAGEKRKLRSYLAAVENSWNSRMKICESSYQSWKLQPLWKHWK